MSWSDQFEDPEPGCKTLKDAANLIQKLPNQKLPNPQQQLRHWQAAVEALIMAAEGRCPMQHARVGMLKALNHGRARVFSDREETQWGKRKLKRDK